MSRPKIRVRRGGRRLPPTRSPCLGANQENPSSVPFRRGGVGAGSMAVAHHSPPPPRRARSEMAEPRLDGQPCTVPVSHRPTPASDASLALPCRGKRIGDRAFALDGAVRVPTSPAYATKVCHISDGRCRPGAALRSRLTPLERCLEGGRAREAGIPKNEAGGNRCWRLLGTVARQSLDGAGRERERERERSNSLCRNHSTRDRALGRRLPSD